VGESGGGSEGGLGFRTTVRARGGREIARVIFPTVNVCHAHHFHEPSPGKRRGGGERQWFIVPTPTLTQRRKWTLRSLYLPTSTPYFHSHPNLLPPLCLPAPRTVARPPPVLLPTFNPGWVVRKQTTMLALSVHLVNTSVAVDRVCFE
jgi:hypothetical protein